MPIGFFDGCRALAIATMLPVVLYAVGSSLVRWDRRLDDEERFAVAWGAGLAWLALGQFLAFLIGGWQVPAILLWVAAPVVCASLRRPRGFDIPSWRPTGWILALGYLHLVLIQALLPIYEGGTWFYDWWMHYDEASVFLGLRPITTEWLGRYTLASRTPLFNLAAAGVMSAAGPEFWVFQLASTAANFAILPAAGLVLRDLAGPRAARLGLLLAPLNLWLMHNAWFTWPKLLTAAYLMIALHFHIRAARERASDPAGARRLGLRSWVAALLGFMTHQVAAIYLLAMLASRAVLAIRGGIRRLDLRHATACVLAAVAIVGPWYSWVAYTFGAAAGVASTPTLVMHSDTPFEAETLVRTVPLNLLRSVYPEQLVEALRTGQRKPLIYHHLLTSFYFNQLSGLLTISLTLFAPIAAVSILVRSRRQGFQPAVDGRAAWSTAFFAGAGGLGAMILHPGVQEFGIAHSALFPSSIAIALIVWAGVSVTPGWAARLAVAGAVVEFSVGFWSHILFVNAILPDLRRGRFDNSQIKAAAHLVFLEDIVSPLLPLAALACVAVQVGLGYSLLRRDQPQAERPEVV